MTLALIDGVMDLAPEYGEENVTLPMGAVLDWAMGTPAGFAAFRDERINGALKAILQEWCTFLDSADSLYVLHDGPNGWKSAAPPSARGGTIGRQFAGRGIFRRRGTRLLGGQVPPAGSGNDRAHRSR